MIRYYLLTNYFSVFLFALPAYYSTTMTFFCPDENMMCEKSYKFISVSYRVDAFRKKKLLVVAEHKGQRLLYSTPFTSSKDAVSKKAQAQNAI